jgi:hypothetical protein
MPLNTVMFHVVLVHVSIHFVFLKSCQWIWCVTSASAKKSNFDAGKVRQFNKLIFYVGRGAKSIYKILCMPVPTHPPLSIEPDACKHRITMNEIQTQSKPKIKLHIKKHQRLSCSSVVHETWYVCVDRYCVRCLLFVWYCRVRVPSALFCKVCFVLFRSASILLDPLVFYKEDHIKSILFCNEHCMFDLRLAWFREIVLVSCCVCGRVCYKVHN